MKIRYRPMRPKDIGKCAEHLAGHPILQRRYGKLLDAFPSAVSRELGQDSLVAVVFEELQGSTTRFVGVGIAVFVGNDFLSEAKTTPSFWIAPEIVTRIAQDKSPLLSNAQVRANSTTGLNLVVWHNSPYPQDLGRAEVGTATMIAFEEYYRGYRREIFAQADSLEHLWAMNNAGGLYFDRVQGRYGVLPQVTADNFSEAPRNVGLTRELALTHSAAWVGKLFLYAPPQFGFSRGEQRLLAPALAESATDEELSKDLGISVFVIKQTWRTVYERVAAHFPELVSDDSQEDGHNQGRGKQKKQRLLGYLREHPEELRPISRRLLHGGDADQPSSATRKTLGR